MSMIVCLIRINNVPPTSEALYLRTLVNVRLAGDNNFTVLLADQQSRKWE